MKVGELHDGLGCGRKSEYVNKAKEFTNILVLIDNVYEMIAAGVTREKHKDGGGSDPGGSLQGCKGHRQLTKVIQRNKGLSERDKR